MAFRRRQFVGCAIAAAVFAKCQRAIIHHKMFREEIFRRPISLRKKSPQSPPTDFRAVTIKTADKPLRVLVRGLVYFRENIEPIPDRRDFPKRHPGLRHSEGTRIHSQKNDALSAAAVFLQIQFMRSPCVVQRIINVRDRRPEFQLPDRCGQVACRGSQFAAYFVLAHSQTLSDLRPAANATRRKTACFLSVCTRTRPRFLVRRRLL